MPPTCLLVANRGEIAIRILRAAAELGMKTVAIYSEDEAGALHTRRADVARALSGSGVPAYLDGEQILAVARAEGCDAVHPGYGFLSENAAFARRCVEEGITFVGPRVEMLELFGDKVRARAAATAAGVPVLFGTSGPTSIEQATAFYEALPAGDAMMIKAIAGGGGRGMRAIEHRDEIPRAYERCRSEALAAFGNGDLFVERLVRTARHIEIQIAGDGTGAVSHFGERDCSIQRRHQKLVEIAPSPGLAPGVRQRVIAAAVQLAQTVHYDNIGTFEFLVDASNAGDDAGIAFIEANPRLQVEHTVTEEVTGLDLVQIQLALAGGASLASLGVQQHQVPAPKGFAIQVRVNMETMNADGQALPSGGTLSVFDPPSGPGVRVDTFGYAGYHTSPRFDSLLAKVIVRSGQPGFVATVDRCYRALSEFRVDGVATNIPFLQALLQHPALGEGHITTQFLDEHLTDLLHAMTAGHERRYMEPAVVGDSASASESQRAGVRVDRNDPLAVLAYGKAATAVSRAPTPVVAPRPGRSAGADGQVAVSAHLPGTVVSIDVRETETVRPGQALLVIESMKMEHEIKAPTGGIVQRIAVSAGDTLYQGQPLLFINEREVEAAEATEAALVDLDEIRPDLKAVLDRRQMTRDAARPDAVARRRSKSQRTARENVEDLCDPGTFTEYGALVLAAQRSRRSLEELIVKSPADGMITGVGRVNGALFDEPASRCAVMSYDYTVFAGTQGAQNHRKTDRMIDIAEHGRMPMVLFAEGGGGRPGDTDGGGGGQRTFSRFAQLSGLVPMVGITSGRCFAGNASLLGCCDVIIATANSNIGMGGPAMIEGGGLGVFAPEDIGPMSVQVPNGVVDIAVADEAEAVQVAKRYLSYFQGRVPTWESADQRLMRRIIPENRLRVYDVRTVIDTLADTDSVLELRRDFGLGMITSLVRIEGRPVGVIANNPMHLGGAIDADGSDKAARFMQLCDAFDLPILLLCDTPGIMVGPEIETTALVRHSSRMFVIGANLSVPFFTIVLRKAYGLGAIAMAGGSYKVPYFTVSWPTGEFGGMGLEGSVKLGFRDDLAAIEDADERKRVYDKMVARAYENGKALNNAAGFGIDDAIDPAESRQWLASLLRSVRPAAPRTGKKRAAIDAW